MHSKNHRNSKFLLIVQLSHTVSSLAS